MNSERLFVSFWDICLDNFPLGEFTHRRMTSHEARLCIEQARRDGRLLCVSQDDLIAPYQKRKRDNHQALCEALQRCFGIHFSMKDFLSGSAIADDFGYIIRPLNAMQIGNGNQLLVIHCGYRLHKNEANGSLVFDVEPTSIEFHVFESKQGPLSAHGELAFHFHSLPKRLSA
jgi:hypothetical protein